MTDDAFMQKQLRKCAS